MKRMEVSNFKKYYRRTNEPGVYIHKKCGAEVIKGKRAQHLAMCDQDAYFDCLRDKNDPIHLNHITVAKPEAPVGYLGRNMANSEWFKKLKEDMKEQGKLREDQ